jgi:hypothetical protein
MVLTMMVATTTLTSVTVTVTATVATTVDGFKLIVEYVRHYFNIK